MPIPRSLDNVVAGWRYVWPVALERATPLRRAARRRVLGAAFRAPLRPVSGVAPIVVIAVYRRRNAPTVAALLHQVDPAADVRLWALDEPHPALAAHTLGVGPSPKFTLVNRLVGARPVPDGAYVAVADDDVCFAGGDLPTAVRIAAEHRLDLFQPSHAWSSIFTYPLLLHRPRWAARQTTFVECGPLFVVGPRGRDTVLPLPEDLGMGWGVEVTWCRHARYGLRLGVIDACRVVHLNPVGTSYDSKVTKAVLEAQLRDVGARSVYQLQRVVDRWPARRRGAAW